MVDACKSPFEGKKRLKKFRLPRPGKPRTPLTLPSRCGVGQARKRACDTFTRNTHSNKTDSQYVKNSTLAFVKENGETREETLKRSDCWNELIPPSSTPRGAREVCVTLLSKGFVPYSDRGKRQEHEFMRAHVCFMSLLTSPFFSPFLLRSYGSKHAKSRALDKAYRASKKHWSGSKEQEARGSRR